MNILLWFETKKTLLAPVLIAFTALCMILNITIMLFGGNVYEYAERESEPYNVFEGYDASDIADYYIAKYRMSNDAEGNIREKYDRLQTVIDKKALNGDALSAYFGQGTYSMHGLLFGNVLYAIIAEGCLIALFTALMSTGYENTSNTEQIVCASTTGRGILRTKLMASLIAGLVFFAVILAVSLLVFFARFDYSAVWGDNVSSAFNYARREYGNIPFITWRSFTVREYTWAVVAAGAGLTVIFSLFGFVLSVFFRSGYLACGISIILCILQFIIPPLSQIGGTFCGVLTLMPVMLWLSSPFWFTDGGAMVVWANYETVGLSALFVSLTAAGLVAVTVYKRRDLL